MMKMKSSSFRLFLLVGYSTLVSPLPDLSRLIGDHVNSHPRGIRRGQAGGYYGDNDNDGVFCEPIEDSTYSDAADAFAEKSSYSCAPTNAGQICTIDFTPVVEVGDMDTLLTLCKDAGGGLYLGAATTSCESGAFLNKYIDYPLCQSNCNDDLINTFIFEGASVNDDPDDDCIFSSVEYLYEYGGKNNNTKPTVPPTTSPTPYPSSQPISSSLPRTSAPSDGQSLGICEETEDPKYGDVVGYLFEDKYFFECGAITTNGLSCTYGFNKTVVEEGGFDKVLSACQDAGGGLYVSSYSFTCDDGLSNSELKNWPFCLARCAVDFLKEFFVEGGPASDDCIFTSVESIYEYVGENNNTKPTVPPTTSPTPYPSSQPITSPLPRTSAPSDGQSLGICDIIEDPKYDDAFGNLYFNKYISECGEITSNGLSCIIGFNKTVVEEGGFDKVLSACQDAGGVLYISSYSFTCDDGLSSSEIKNYPFCLARCAVDFLKELFVEGGSAGDDCIFTSVESIYEYGGKNNNNTIPTVPPTTSPTPYPSTKPGNYTLSPTLGPTLSPVSSRTDPPSPPSSSSSCDDSPLMFMVHDIPRCCKWVARNPTERCDEMWAKGAELDIHVKSHCAKSCGSCDKYGCSDTVGTFIVDDHEHRECCWLDSLSESHKVELCLENRIYTTCQDTCGIPCTQ